MCTGMEVLGAVMGAFQMLGGMGGGGDAPSPPPVAAPPPPPPAPPPEPTLDPNDVADAEAMRQRDLKRRKAAMSEGLTLLDGTTKSDGNKLLGE